MTGLETKVALVTGAGSGIGLATTRRLAEEGAVVVAGLLDESQRSAVSEFEALVLDVRSERDWDQVITHVEALHGRLDILINNAGIHRTGTAEETTAELWAEVMAVNLWGTFLGCKKAIPIMRRHGGGAIVNLSSINSIRGVPGMVAYNTSKGSIHTMTKALAMDHVADNIRMNCVCPGAIETPIIEGMLARAADPAALRATISAKHAMNRMGTVDEVAAVIAFLASDDASFMTGLAIPVDGGRSVR
jgi:meso-butanediol dehydrogenase / (S,S)-butanediol dehydrogenase / diacetyl reductase